ncbi:MAG: hypothetical protein LKE41_00845 [Prevotella sp.]|jgi:hypothetical protein|nr:hypothetical protein [Prevotella sp.]
MEVTVQFDGIDFAGKDEFLEGGAWDNYQTKISGVNYRVKPEEVDSYAATTGYCMYNNDNAEHPEAVRIEDSHHRLLGFIPKEELKKYKAWAKGKVLPCVIGIKPFMADDGDIRLAGYCVVIKARDEEELASQVQHYVTRYYEKYKQAISEFKKPGKTNNAGCATNLIVVIIALAALLRVICE